MQAADDRCRRSLPGQGHHRRRSPVTQLCARNLGWLAPAKVVPTPTAKEHQNTMPVQLVGWLRGTEVESQFLAGKLSLSCARPAADGWPLMWVNRPL